MPDVLSKRFVLCLVVAGSLSVACGNGANPSTPTPTIVTSATATPTPTATPSVESQVSVAYLSYWDAYASAVLNLDAQLVHSVAMGDELKRLTEEIDKLRADGVALRVIVEHDFAVVQATNSKATVVDRVVNNSFFVDPLTKNPPRAEGNGEVLRYTFFMELVNGRWLVTGGFREPGG